MHSSEQASRTATARCPDENDITAFARGELAPREHAAIEAHLDGCPACASVVTELARLFGPMGSRVAAPPEPTLASGPAARGDDDWLVPGERLGRYRVLERVGAGGMGVVYAAYDPELDRRVAVKLLRDRGTAGGVDSEGRARLLREAQALARLSHPNVVAVHDVGTFGERLFLAMEFVDGVTLGRWLAEQPRDGEAVREVFLAAGRGLAAAHAAGIVHRDFKPDNVLIDRGRAGAPVRARVTDFGLARVLGDGDDRRREAPPTSVGPAALTQTGALVGTPAYMAPEQLEGGPVDARSDQYSFCVALYEALWGRRPFVARTLAELVAATQAEVPTPPAEGTAGVRVPPALRDAILRGLSRDPARRFGDMDALLVQLEPARTRGRALWFALAVPVTVAAAAGAVWLDRTRETPTMCRGDALAGVWDAHARDEIAALLGASAPGLGETVAQGFAGTIDRYAAQYEALRGRACTPASADDRAPGVAALRMLCLEERRAHLQATLQVVRDAAGAPDGRGLLSRAPMIAESLPSLDACDDVATMAAHRGDAVPPAMASAVIDARSGLAQAAASLTGGDYDGALQQLDRVAPDIEALGFAPLQAELRLARARTLLQLGRIDEARSELEAGSALAVTAGDRQSAAAILVELLYVFGQSGTQVELGEFVARQARAEIDALGDPPRVLSRWHKNRASLLWQAGKADDAIAALREALALTSVEGAPLFRIEILFDLAKLQVTNLQFDEAAAALAECRALVVEQLGTLHPRMADVEFAEGLGDVAQLRWQPALAHFERAAEIRAATVGEDHPDYASDLATVGDLLGYSGRHDEALAALRRAIAIDTAALGPDHVMTLNFRLRLAQAELGAGQAEAAMHEASTALERAQRVLAPGHPFVAAGVGVLAAAQRAAGHGAEALVTMQKAVELSVASEGPSHPDTAIAIGELGELQLEQQRYDEAIVSLEQAIALCTDDSLVGSERAWFVYLLARARQAGGHPPADAASERQALLDAIARLERADDPQRAAAVRQFVAERARLTRPRSSSSPARP
ncbi:MAG: tetratricopeptide repeat protein [Nannocystaceae bacterium]|nr:tetratricopeptide repeat protein [Nannocystaceae bacterium]